MNEVGHGQFDDIFQQSSVADMAYEIESLALDSYVRKDLELTDPQVRETYKTIYEIHSKQKQVEGPELDSLTRALLEQYQTRSQTWEESLDEAMVGQVYRRLMISIKKMSGGRMGNKGYLNYLKNNFDVSVPEDKFIVEDKFGNKSIQEYQDFE